MLKRPFKSMISTCLPPGENEPPVEQAPEAPLEDYGNTVFSERSSLDWRSIIEGAGLRGPIKNLASQAQVLTLEDNLVVLRLSIGAFATESNRQQLEVMLTAHFGRAFHVRFEVGELTSETVSDEVARERAAKMAERVRRFKQVPLVAKLINEMGAMLEESTVVEHH